jgi:histidinol-phosphate aminotransferase
MNQTSIDAGVAAIREDAYFKNIVSDIVATREKAKKNLAELGFTFTDSKTNFIFSILHKTVPAEKIFEELKAKNIYVRYFNKPRINNYLRITVGTEEEMNALYCALREILESETNR